MRFFLPLALFLAIAAPVSAEPSREQQLDALFGELHQATAPDKTAKIEADIWALWAHNDSATAEHLLRQAVAAMNSSELDAAEQTLVQLVESYPDFSEAWNKRATVYYMLGRYDASLVDIEKVLDLEPRHFGALAGKAMILRAQKHDREALKVLQEALTMNPHMESVKQAIKDLEKLQPDI